MVYLITCAIQCVGSTDAKTGNTKFRHRFNNKSEYKQFLKPKNYGTLTSNPISKQRFMPFSLQANLMVFAIFRSNYRDWANNLAEVMKKSLF